MLKKEIRMAEVRIAPATNDDMIVEGYAAVFEQETVMWEYDGIQYKEIVSRNAFDGCDTKDASFKYNHSDTVMIMARTRNKTLQLVVDDVGLLIRANLAPTTAGNDLYTLIKRGDIDKMSIAFVVKSDAYDSNLHLRRINQFEKLYDVAAVDLPAYSQTSISARDFFKAKTEGDKTRIREEVKKRLIVQTYL